MVSDAAVPDVREQDVESATVSASSGSVDRDDLALGFGLGLILATACAIATRDDPRSPAQPHGALVTRENLRGEAARSGGPLSFS